MSEYDNTHRAFLQAFMARNTLTFDEAQPILAAILTAHEPDRPTLEGDISREQFNEYVHMVNQAISDFDYQIKNTRSQIDRKQVYALVNLSSDSFTQLATSHTAEEIAFVKRCLDAMFDTNNTREAEVMAITTTQGHNLAKPSRRSDAATQATQGSASQGLTMSQAEKVMQDMVDEGWFEKSDVGFLRLSPRALIELKEWLVDTYNVAEEDEDGEVVAEEEKIKFCEACRDIITVGQRCSNYDCNCRLHDTCTAKYFQRQSTRKCPRCAAEWTGEDLVGEKAAKRRGGAGSSKRRANGSTQRRKQEQEEQEEEEEEEEAEEAEEAGEAEDMSE